MRIQDADVKLKIITERKDNRLVYTVLSLFERIYIFRERELKKRDEIMKKISCKR